MRAKNNSGIETLNTSFASPPNIVRSPDGKLLAFCIEPVPGDSPVRGRYSHDNGFTWSKPLILFGREGLPSGLWSVAEAVVDKEGEIHAFMLNQWKPGRRGEFEKRWIGKYYGSRIDIWHTRSFAGRSCWQKPRCIWEGYTGPLNSSLILCSGRIILPFSFCTSRTWSNGGRGLKAFTFAGMFDSAALYLGDSGKTWTCSKSAWVQTPDIVSAYRACEQVAIEKKDGTVWMLLRTQNGRFYETFSADGSKWSRPTLTSLISSDLPAGLTRFNNGRVVLVWNLC